MKLHDHLRQKGVSQATFAKVIGISQGALSKICAGVIKPSGITAARIEAATDGMFPAASWFSQEIVAAHDAASAQPKDAA